MVTHQTPGPNRPLEALRNPAQVVDKALTISIAEENILTRVPTRHHMVKSTFKLYSKWTGHKPILAGQLVPMHDTRPDPKVSQSFVPKFRQSFDTRPDPKVFPGNRPLTP